MSKTVFITGANKSIGFETAKQLLKEGYHVYLGCRDLKNGQEAVDKLKAEGFNEVEAIQIDVADQKSVENARTVIGQKTEILDALINNAGINGGMPQAALEATTEQFRNVYETNLFGVVNVTQAFFDLLEKAENPRIVMVSSLGASMTLHNDPSWKYYAHKAALYPSSKAALNMYTIALAYELRDTAFKVNAIDPGFTKTDFNGHRGTGSVEDAGKRIAKYALTGENMPTGKFISEEQNPISGEIPW
tara:strand:- start:29477 stop:30217 length:741 start_codon:yes stop_codon:yes gene_type:complete